MSVQPVLKTKRLVLRPFTFADAPALEALAGLREVADTTLNIPHPYPKGAAAVWIATHPVAWDSGTGVVFAIVHEGELCGVIDIVRDVRHQSGELGYWIAPADWGKGFATEAVVEMIRFGFEDLGLHRIHAAHFTRNPASGRVMAKAGMQFEGINRGLYQKNGIFEDAARYAVVRGDS